MSYPGSTGRSRISLSAAAIAAFLVPMAAETAAQTPEQATDQATDPTASSKEDRPTAI